jgi:hypothetical protein
VPLSGSNAMEGGVWIADAPSTLVGGADASSRNVFANLDSGGFFTSAGVLIGESSVASAVVNNYFGVLPNGVTEGPIDHGIVNFADDVEIDDNLINNASEWAVRLNEEARKTVVSRNRLGLPSFCFGPCPTTQGNVRSILIEGSASSLWLNDVANSQANGVRVTGNDNSLFRTQVYGGGLLTPPIDIGLAGFNNQQLNNVFNPTPGNRSLNWPQLQSANRSLTGNLRVTGLLASANGNYQIDFYGSPRRLNTAAPTPRCEGRVYLGTIGTLVISNAAPLTNGTVAFTASLDQTSISTDFITAVAQRRVVIDGELRSGDASEYGNCLEVPLFSDGFEQLN